MKYEIECTSCRNTFTLDVDSHVMDEYMLRASGHWNKCSNGKQKCWRPLSVVLKDLDEQTQLMLENAICKSCLDNLYAKEKNT